MPATLDDLPGALDVPTRDAERDRWLQDYQFRDPGTDTSAGTEPYVRGSVFADMVMPLYANSVTSANATDPSKVSGPELDVRAGAVIGPRLPQRPGSGSVTITASVGGTTIFVGDELTANGLRFKCNATALYNDGDQVPVIGIDAGPATNLAPGTILTWSNPRPGCGPNATVFQNVDGTGFTGGRNEETDEEYRKRWTHALQSPAASGNDAEIQALAEATFGVPVEKAFTYPAILGPGTSGLVFTIRVDAPGQSRIPDGTQIALVAGNVSSAMPADEAIIACSLGSVPIDVTLSITWDDGAPGWQDATTWPPYYSAGGAIKVTAATSPTSFTVNGTTTVQPQVGQHIAVYSRPTGLFFRKTILSFTGTGPWVITCDATNNASDLSYTPVVGQRVCPWSDSLQDIVSPMFNYFKTLGPGEQLAVFFDTGTRQRRQPQSPHSWPSVISNKGIATAIEISSIFDAAVLEPTVPLATTIGSQGVISNLMEMNFLAAFPQ